MRGALQSRAPSAIPGPPDWSESLRLRDLLERAATRDPALAAARERALGAQDARGRAGRLPDPMLRLGWFGESVQTRTGTQEMTLSLHQALPWPGKLSVLGDLADVAAEAERVRTWIVGRDLAVEVAQAYHELRYLHAAFDLSTALDGVARRYVALAANGLDGRLTGVSDVIRAETFLAQLEYDRLVLREWISVEEERLRVRLDLPTSAALGRPADVVTPKLRVDLASLQALALRHSHDLLLAELDVRSARLGARRARQGRYPDLSLGVRWIDTEGYGLGAAGDGDDPWMIEIGVGLPVWAGAQRATESEARHRLRSMSYGLDRARAQLRIEMTRAYYRSMESQRLVDLHYGTLLPQAERAAQAAEGLLASGDTNMAGLLETISAWHHLRLAALRAEIDAAQHWTQLERLVGRPLPTWEVAGPQGAAAAEEGAQ